MLILAFINHANVSFKDKSIPADEVDDWLTPANGIGMHNPHSTPPFRFHPFFCAG